MSNSELEAASLRDALIGRSHEDVAPYYDIVERTLASMGSRGIPNCPDGQFIGSAKRQRLKKRS
jgi:hypothetical protein